jgi:hypothetical protein
MMRKQPHVVIGYFLLACLLSACASGPIIMVPDTQPSDQIKDEYLIGEWCTNREETATSNQEAGFSGILNVRPVFWRLRSEGQWDISVSGFLYEPYGSWQVDGLNTLLLGKKSMQGKPYQMQFKNGDLYLTDDKGQFTVLSRCD